MDLSTTYMGLELSHPLMPGASPMVDDLDTVKRLEDAGASAIVMHSLFEEQITSDELAAHRHLDMVGESSAEALSYFPSTDVFRLQPDAYLEQIRRIRAAVSVPVIASLNGSTPGGWLDYAQRMEQAGAHALELNLYVIASDAGEDGCHVESRSVEIVHTVRQAVKIPLAVKLSPFYSALPNFVNKLERAGADAVVLFNRFYQPDIDVEALAVGSTLRLSDPTELLLRLRWLAVLSRQFRGSLAVTGGVHSSLDAVKAIMTGAHAVQMVSVLLRRGPAHLGVVLKGLEEWLEQHEYESVKQLCGSMDLSRCPNPSAYERANYVHLLQTWHGEPEGA